MEAVYIMGNNIKVIANYLPQYHVIPENNRWWGNGFTDWLAVKKAKPLFLGHNQPRVPLNNHYYSLDDVQEIKWQAELARKYGIYGFGIYHYWFSSDMNLLSTPAELMLHNRDIKINFMFIWDNGSWIRTWSNVRFANTWAPKYDDVAHNDNQSGILAELKYGDENDWKIHFEYLVRFFSDPRYIKLDNKPLFAFFQPSNDFPTIKAMVAYWNELAKDYGFDGIICMTKDNWRGHNLDYRIRYSPFSPNTFCAGLQNKLNNILCKKLKRIRSADYDSYWKYILKDSKSAGKKTFLSGFVDFDDTPRRGKQARMIKGASPEKFEKYIYKLMDISQKQNKEYVFLTAWNEWGEGAYLEPDEDYGYQYLEALKRAVDKINNN